MHKNNYLKELIKPLRLSMYDFTEVAVRDQLHSLFDESAVIHLCHPFGDIKGPINFFKNAVLTSL